MAVLTVTTASKLAYLSVEGSTNTPNQYSMRLAPSATGTVYFERTTKNAPANKDTSNYLTGSEIYSVTLIAGERINVVTDTGTVAIRIDADDSGKFS